MSFFYLICRKLRDSISISVLDQNLLCQIGQDDTIIAAGHIVKDVIKIDALIRSCYIASFTKICIISSCCTGVSAFKIAH